MAGYELSVEVRRKDRYCWHGRCCGAERRVSWRLVRALAMVLVGVLVVTVVVLRAVHKKSTVWGILAEVALSLLALLTPTPW